MGTVSVHNRTRQKVPRAFFDAVAKDILPAWNLSVALVSEREACDLNMRFAGKTYAPNVLSYEVGALEGEVILCPAVAAHEASLYGHETGEHIMYLFIHGCLHLKGYPHGSTMERWEKKLLAAHANIAVRAYETSHRNRNRHRNISGQGGRHRRGNR